MVEGDENDVPLVDITTWETLKPTLRTFVIPNQQDSRGDSDDLGLSFLRRSCRCYSSLPCGPRT